MKSKTAINNSVAKSVAIAISLGLASHAQATVDSRSYAMGGTGVSNANYLTSSLHNPALAARYSDKDDLGFLLPTFSVQAHDNGDLVSEIENFADAFDIWEETNDQAAQDEWQNALRNMDGDSLTANINSGFVIAIPNQYLSTNFFALADLTLIAAPQINAADLEKDINVDDDLQSRMQALTGGTIDIGLTFAREVDVEALPGKLMLGFSPKFQQLVALGYDVGMADADDQEFTLDDAEMSSGFNMDIGVAYDINEQWQLGLNARNIIENSLETNSFANGNNATYVVSPEFTFGASYQRKFVAISADLDLTEKEYFKEIDYSTQYARVGAELDAWSWAQIRAGYAHSLTDYSEDILTAGIGFKAFGVAGFDLAASYGSDNNYGVSGQLIVHF